ncbi:isocitrate lyase [Thermomonas sp.]|uniref:isocitrate lyase n=1 Tax=Thermomonas sp. TaxID=1971895 RepID=UPI001B4B34D5|nr:isocitrate lyase [Thermomonas sp.]MBK6415219.1 isocitrate lyase [Thermomonas sp.]MBL0228580.1 isocitrate lyase [Thermomonas sp.]MBP6438352.1 isocitrate lyase [Thermomonas sp.]MBP7157996.1 isocitrate lyase [Thermomonas sp.]MBP8648062.1 isocitrate lyase [Thermomonas sp.]
MKHTMPTAEQLKLDWANNPRWAGVTRTYSAEDVVRLRGTVAIEHSLARLGAEKLWKSLHKEDFVNALGALTGNQAMQQVKAGLKAIYLSGWQVAADANGAGEMYPDQSLYPVNSVPQVVKRINNTLLRADQLHHAEGDDTIDFLQPIVADAEAGFGGVLNAYELMKAMIEAGAAGVHFEDQLASVKKCGHMGGKVLVPTREAVEKLTAARLAADVMGVPTLIVARTDAEAADLVTSDVDDNDKPFCTGERTVEGFYKTHKGLDQAISRGLAYAPYADLVWCETGKPDLEFARKFAEAIHAKFPGKLLAYNCSPSFNWKKNLDDATIARFQKELGAMGYKFQFITLAGFHALNYGMFDLAHGYARRQMSAFVDLQEKEFAAAERGFTAVKHQREVGTGYFDTITQTIQGGQSSTVALKGSTEEEQFHGERAAA